jgi:hypothetical protein
MPLRISLFALLLCATVATATELKTLKGEVVKGDVVSITSKEIVVKVGEEEKTYALSQIATIDFSAAPKMAADAAYHDIELTDGTILHCSDIQFKGTEFTAKLLGDAPSVKIPMKSVSNILWDANKPDLHAKWTARVAIRRASSANKNDDGIGKLDEKGETLNIIPVTILSADEKGETFTVETSTKEKLTRKTSGLLGLYFHYKLDTDALPAVCKLADIGHNNIMVAAVEMKEGALNVTTSSGVTLTYKPAQLVRLDYSTTNVTYLSDLTPSRVVETSTEDRVDHYRKDKNIDDGPIRLRGQVYAKGLALHSTTELEYKLKGEYLTLQGLAGFDDQVGGHNRPVVLRIYATTAEEPNKLIYDETFNRTDQKARVKPIQKNIKGVQTLRIVVTSVEGDASDLGLPLDMGLHLDLADIRVIK